MKNYNKKNTGSNPVNRIKKDIKKLMTIINRLDNLNPEIDPEKNMKIVKSLEKSTIKLQKGIQKDYNKFPKKENPEEDLDTKE